MGKVKSFSDYLKNVEKLKSINSGRSFYIEGQDVSKMASDLIEFMKSEGIDFGNKVPDIDFTRAKQKGKESPFFKETAHYTPLANLVVIYTQGRSLKDCLRSLSHELIHADQYINKGIDIEKASEGIYGKSKDVVDIEADAYESGNVIFRKWEESLRQK